MVREEAWDQLTIFSQLAKRSVHVLVSDVSRARAEERSATRVANMFFIMRNLTANSNSVSGLESSSSSSDECDTEKN